jgi:hypothetical protein
MDVTVLDRFVHSAATAWFDAMAPYHPTAVGVHSRLGRRPSSEAATNRNKNIAALYASYQVTRSMVPEVEPVFRELLTSISLDPDDESEDRTSPVGIGNLAGKAVVAARERDGINQLGDEGRRYNGWPYEDYTGYRPVNTAFDLVNPSRWPPKLGTHNRRLGGGAGDLGVFTVQNFVTPQLALTRAHTFRDPGQFSIAPAPARRPHPGQGLQALGGRGPGGVGHAHRRAEGDGGVLRRQAAGRHRLVGERRGSRPWRAGLGRPGASALRGHGGDVRLADRRLAPQGHARGRAAVQRGPARVRQLPGDAWGGPGMGTVNDIPANEWSSYLNVADHPEYPSGSAVICSAQAQASRRFFDDDVLDLRYTADAGSSLVEPEITPASDLELHFATWTDFVQDCATSRVWGGVHFAKSAEVSIPFGEQFGDMAYEYVQRHINGDIDSY